MSTKKHTTKDRIINISSLKPDFKNPRETFELIQIEVQCRKNYLKIFLFQEAGASGNNIEKEPQKPRPKLKKYNIKYLQGIFALPSIQCKWYFFANMY